LAKIEENSMNRFRFTVLAGISVLFLTAVAPAVFGAPADSAFARATSHANYGRLAFSYDASSASSGDVTFSYDPALATNVQGRAVASNAGQGASAWEVRPNHINFSFDGYPVKGLASPQIRAIPFAEYKLAQAGTSISGELNALEKYLSRSGATGVPLPQLPPVNAQRIIAENVAPVAGAGVSGVRFVASYAQGIAPVTADNVTYMFIGLTSDRKYYVDGVFPVSLSAPLDSPPSPFTAESAQAYNQAVAERLRNTDPSGFTPTLDTLDKMMGSVQVNPSGIPGMPSTGVGKSQYEGAIFVVLALATMLIIAGLMMFIRSKARP
jgi:hypothetical protein